MSPHPIHRQGSRRRNGRLLVECLIAALLVSIATLSLAATTRGTLALADDASLITRAQSVATSRLEDALALHCTPALAGLDQSPRVTLTWQQASSAQTTSLHIDASLDRSPIAFNNAAPIAFAMEGGGVCR